MENNTKKKATRKLKSFDFSTEDSAVALVGPSVGSAANGHTTVLFKSVGTNRSEDFIKKAQQIQVTLEIPEFLQKFFGLWYEDARVLAALMGYVEDSPEDELSTSTYEDYIQEKISSFKILKSVQDGANLAKTLMSLSEEEHLTLLKDQEYLESIMKQVNAVNEPVSGSVKNKETTMLENVETVTKSQFETVQKALDDKEVALQKALADIEVLQKAQKEAVRKARFDKTVDALKDEGVATVVFKAVGLVESDEDFAEIIKALGDLQSKVEKSALFVEQGASGDVQEDPVQESAVAKLVKARYVESK
jgi:hypothetical protein